MPEEQTKQAVATEADTGATPPVEDSGAQEPTVDELLSEFETGDTNEPKGDTQTAPKQGDGEVSLSTSQRKQIMEDLRSEMKVEDELNTSVKDIKGDLDVEDEYVRWKLEELAKSDERIWKAFIARNSNPKAWEAITKKLQKELTGKYGKVATTDKEKIASAVHSATQTSGTPSGETDVKKLSDVDFEMQKEGIMRKAMAGAG